MIETDCTTNGRKNDGAIDAWTYDPKTGAFTADNIPSDAKWEGLEQRMAQQDATREDDDPEQ